jgi:hypothetical protein
MSGSGPSATTPLPARSYSYSGPITDPARWGTLRHRKGDIFICAPAKSGTTWLQAICAMLIFGTAELDVAPAKVSPWFDANLAPPDAVSRMLEAQQHRRYLKTHTPLDGIPYFPDCNYIAVYRDPRDTFLSMMRLAAKTAQGRPAASRIADLHGLFDLWLKEPFRPGQAEQMSLASIAHHFNLFWKHRSLPNIHLVHFSDLKRDPSCSIRRIAAALGIAADDELIGRIAESTSFANMRDKAEQFAPGIGRGQFRSESDFFHSGDDAQWREFVTASESAAYAQRVSALMTPDAAAWLEHGSAIIPPG